jgi:hypothetical protein
LRGRGKSGEHLPTTKPSGDQALSRCGFAHALQRGEWGRFCASYDYPNILRDSSARVCSGEAQQRIAEGVSVDEIIETVWVWKVGGVSLCLWERRSPLLRQCGTKHILCLGLWESAS